MKLGALKSGLSIVLYPFWCNAKEAWTFRKDIDAMFLNSSAFYVVFTLFPKRKGALSWPKVMLESSYLRLQILRYHCTYFAHVMRCGSVGGRQDNTQKSPKNAMEDRQIIQDKLTVVPIWSVISKASQGPFLKCKRFLTSFPNRVQGLALRESPI